MANTTIPAEVNRLETAKSQLASAITAKGVAVPTSAKLDTYPGYVAAIPSGRSPRTYQVVVGTIGAGWTEQDCDYLCTGSNDYTVISQAIAALPDEGGVLYFLDGTYTLNNSLEIARDNISLVGNHCACVLSNRGSACGLAISGDGCLLEGLSMEDARPEASQATVVVTGANFCIRGCRFTNLSISSLDISGQDALLKSTCFASAQITAAAGTHNGVRVWECNRISDMDETLPWLEVSGNDIDITGNYILSLIHI